jgi:hypothetical protein
MRDRLTDSINGVVETMADAGRQETKNAIKNAAPALSEFFREDDGIVYANPGDDIDEDEEIDEDLDEDEEYAAMSFDSIDAHDDNLLLAAAAFRALGTDKDFVAQHPLSGITFFGSHKDFVEFCSQRDLNTENWTTYQPNEVLGLDYDPEALKEMLEEDEALSEKLEEAYSEYEKFHWGDSSTTTSVLSIPGMDGSQPLVFLGIAREISFEDEVDLTNAEDDEPWENYVLGDDPPSFPCIYGLGEKCLVIAGGELDIEDFEEYSEDNEKVSAGSLNIPGLNRLQPLTFLGYGRRVCYGAKKNGSFHEYYHHFGEVSRTYPGVYALADKYLVIVGGDMHIEGRGIVD